MGEMTEKNQTLKGVVVSRSTGAGGRRLKVEAWDSAKEIVDQFAFPPLMIGQYGLFSHPKETIGSLQKEGAARVAWNTESNSLSGNKAFLKEYHMSYARQS
jgi:hypothetical protein